MKNILEQQKQEAIRISNRTYVERDAGVKTADILNTPLVKLITGPRRAGKSVFAFLLLKQTDYAYLNFDDDDLLKSFSYEKLMEVLPQVYPGFKYLFIDEIQNLPEWELLVNKLHRRGYNLVLTGSNAALLSRELGSFLTGRFLPIQIFPFSFREFLRSKHCEFSASVIKTPEDHGMVLGWMKQYLNGGGFPECIINQGIADEYLTVLFDSVLLKDVVKRFRIKNTQQLYTLANYLLTIYSAPFTFTSVSGILDLKSPTTAQKFVKFLEEPYLFFSLSRFDQKLQVQNKSPKKSYIVDNGFIKARSRELSPNSGRLLENLVFIELLRRGYKINRDLFYYRTHNNKEVDFLCRKGYQNDTLIQVCYDMGNTKTLQREISALHEANNELKPANAIVLTWQEEDHGRSDGICILPVWKWLLDYATITETTT